LGRSATAKKKKSYTYSLRDVLKICDFVFDVFVIKTFYIATKISEYLSVEY